MQLFILSHLASDYEYLLNILRGHSRFIVGNGQRIYSHFTDIDNSSFDINCDILLYNHSLASKELYKICKFIFLVRQPEAVLNENPELLTYYCFRLQRLAQLSKETDGIFLSWKDMSEGIAFKKIEEFLNLKKSFNINTKLERTSFNPVNKKSLYIAERAYDKYVSKIKSNLTN